ncbi:MAG: GGDEF domain-containing protein [Elioraea sp.]|nr:GGDEF domain-containing protein [Elioraea sp.]MDW8443499.1 GGDEF domain-containing protein [Acetobacteraceae bacterium]
MPLDVATTAPFSADRPDPFAALFAESAAALPDGDPCRMLLKRAERIAQRASEVLRLQAARIRELERLAEADPLTGLLNRRGLARRLAERLAEAARHREPGVLMFCDMDGLKAINDRLGHAAGDAAILATARAIRDSVRATDTVARIGGDEFAVVMARVDAEQGLALAARLAAAVRRTPFAWQGEAIQLGLSVGLAPFTGEEEPEALLAIADRAMYAEKRSGRAG